KDGAGRLDGNGENCGAQWLAVKDDLLGVAPQGPVSTVFRNLPLALAECRSAGLLRNPERTNIDLDLSIILEGSIGNPVHIRRKDASPLVGSFSEEQDWFTIALERQHPQVVSRLGCVLGVVEQEAAVGRPAGGIMPQPGLLQQFLLVTNSRGGFFVECV